MNDDIAQQRAHLIYISLFNKDAELCSRAQKIQIIKDLVAQNRNDDIKAGKMIIADIL